MQENHRIIEIARDISRLSSPGGEGSCRRTPGIWLGGFWRLYGWRIHNLSTQPVPGFIQQKKVGILVCFHMFRQDLLYSSLFCPWASLRRSWMSSLLPSRNLSTPTSPRVFSFQSQLLLTPKMLQSLFQTLSSKSTDFLALGSPELDPALQTWPQQWGAGEFSEN